LQLQEAFHWPGAPNPGFGAGRRPRPGRPSLPHRRFAGSSRAKMARTSPAHFWYHRHKGAHLMVDSSEQIREFPRYEVNAYVDFTGNEVLLFHRIQNISLGGVCIATSGVEEVGTLVDLVLNFPELDASIAIKGEVVWANHEPPMDMGIRYIDLDDERKDTLRKYINMVRKT
jgi:uncharacterized protein (TIGR02266 family)